MEYFKITRININKPKPTLELPFRIYEKMVIAFFVLISLTGIALIELLIKGKIVFVYFLPIYALTVWVNKRIFKQRKKYE